jgi:mRNA-degrading endonuclease toxin of MazEF toxin-antitoxin module
VLLSKSQSKLKQDCVVLACQITCIDRGFLETRVATLSSSALRQISEGMKLTLDLSMI